MSITAAAVLGIGAVLLAVQLKGKSNEYGMYLILAASLLLFLYAAGNIAEFASGICRDAGYGALGSQIEIFAKLSILAISMPVLLALLETLQEFLA